MSRSSNRLGIGFLLVTVLTFASCSPTEPTGESRSITPIATTTAEDLLVVGDWGSGTRSQDDVARAMRAIAEETGVAAILTTGDNFYSDNAELLMEPYAWVDDLDLEWWITWGNHDVESQSTIEAVDETFGAPPRWGTYSWGDIDVIILDTNQPTSTEQAEFFQAAMAASDRPTIVSLHHPPYTCSARGSTMEAVADLVDTLDDDVFLVLSGHEHSYQRFETTNVVFIVSGGGGRSLQPLADCPDDHADRLASAETHHFLVLTQTQAEVGVIAYDVHGESIDSVEIPISP